VIAGRIAAGETTTTLAHFTAPAGISAGKSDDLEQRARRVLASADAATSPVARQDARSFLQAVAELLVRPDASETAYTYSGRPYRLRLSRTTDNKAALYFRERRLIAAETEVIRINAKVQRKAGGKETEFRLWIPTTGDRRLPVRIDYQAKSYLRLVFEAQPAGS
jgi:hypothetical protein